MTASLKGWVVGDALEVFIKSHQTKTKTFFLQVVFQKKLFGV